jgi:hypothetical protein
VRELKLPQPIFFFGFVLLQTTNTWMGSSGIGHDNGDRGLWGQTFKIRLTSNSNSIDYRYGQAIEAGIQK